jgi:hypothetical protein
LFVLLFCLKNRKIVRAKVADFLVLLLNKNIKKSTYFFKPYCVLTSFYGENSVAAVIDSLSKLPQLTKKEKEVLMPIVEKSYYFSLSAVNFYKSNNLLALGEAGFGFFLE